jgi:hypothetical protein
MVIKLLFDELETSTHFVLQLAFARQNTRRNTDPQTYKYRQYAPPPRVSRKHGNPRRLPRGGFTRRTHFPCPDSCQLRQKEEDRLHLQKDLLPEDVLRVLLGREAMWRRLCLRQLQERSRVRGPHQFSQTGREGRRHSQLQTVIKTMQLQKVPLPQTLLRVLQFGSRLLGGLQVRGLLKPRPRAPAAAPQSLRIHRGSYVEGRRATKVRNSLASIPLNERVP